MPNYQNMHFATAGIDPEPSPPPHHGFREPAAAQQQPFPGNAPPASAGAPGAALEPPEDMQGV